jgi:hypothetical protein
VRLFAIHEDPYPRSRRPAHERREFPARSVSAPRGTEKGRFARGTSGTALHFLALLTQRKLLEKETLIYAPMCDVGETLYDKDAVYVEMGQNVRKLDLSSGEKDILGTFFCACQCFICRGFSWQWERASA